MNFEKTQNQSQNKMSFNKSLATKGMAISLTVLLGACASSGNKKEPVEPSAAPDKQVVQKAEQEPAPSAAELMKTLKAPLVEPPGAKVAQEVSKPAPVKTAPVVVSKEAEKKKTEAAAETKKQLELAKASQESAAEKVPVVTEKTVAVEQQPVVVTQKVSASDAKPFNVSVKKLPFTYDIWTIREGNTPLTKGLVIATPTWEMGKEGYTSQIWLTMMEDKIHVNSSSDIETASKGLGIRIDGGDLIPFSSIADNNIGVIEGKWLDKLAMANKIDIYLGFFPGKKPTSDTFTSDLSLNNLARIVATYRVLN